MLKSLLSNLYFVSIFCIMLSIFWMGMNTVSVVITTPQLHSTKPELRFCADSNPAHGVSEI